MNRTAPRLQQQTSGFRERKPGHFADVDRQLNAWLLKNDPRFLRDSENSRRRAVELQERRERERQPFEPTI